MDNTVKVDNIFPTFFATKTLDLKKINIVGNKFSKTFESEIETTLEGQTLLDINSMNYLNLQLTDMLAHLLKNRCKTFVFKMTGMWMNKYDNNNYQGTHCHPGDFSFIIYYKTDKSYTVFNSPVKNLLEMGKNSYLFDVSYDPIYKEGDIVMFPSYLDHWVKPNSNSITIAGNIKIEKLNV